MKNFIGMLLMLVFLLSGCLQREEVRYVEFNHLKYEETSLNTFYYQDDYIYVEFIDSTLEFTFSFVEATMVLQSNGDFYVRYDQGTTMTCNMYSCQTYNVGTVLYGPADFRLLAQGIKTQTPSTTEIVSPGIVLVTIIFVTISSITLFVGTSFDRTKSMIEFFYSISWRFKGNVEPSDLNVKLTMIYLWGMLIFTIFWILFIFII